jgi:hypothetical protein
VRREWNATGTATTVSVNSEMAINALATSVMRSRTPRSGGTAFMITVSRAAAAL